MVAIENGNVKTLFELSARPLFAGRKSKNCLHCYKAFVHIVLENAAIKKVTPEFYHNSDIFYEIYETFYDKDRPLRALHLVTSSRTVMKKFVFLHLMLQYGFQSNIKIS